jgi:GDP-mannose 6-dehydrogenase
MVPAIGDVLAHAKTIVIGNASPEFRDVPKRLDEGQLIVDLVRIADTRSVEGVYDGICW